MTPEQKLLNCIDQIENPKIFKTAAEFGKQAAGYSYTLTEDEWKAKIRTMDDGSFKTVVVGALERMASTNEKILTLLEVALQPLLEQSDKRRREIFGVIDVRIEKHVKRLEDKHGTMPSIIRNKILHQLRGQIGVEYHELYAAAKHGSPAYVRDGTDYSMIVVPPGGPKTKTRAAYNTWIKQKKAKRSAG